MTAVSESLRTLDIDDEEYFFVSPCLVEEAEEVVVGCCGRGSGRVTLLVILRGEQRVETLQVRTEPAGHSGCRHTEYGVFSLGTHGTGIFVGYSGHGVLTGGTCGRTGRQQGSNVETGGCTGACNGSCDSREVGGLLDGGWDGSGKAGAGDHKHGEDEKLHGRVDVCEGGARSSSRARVKEVEMKAESERDRAREDVGGEEGGKEGRRRRECLYLYA